MKCILITGGAGFFGGLLIERLLADGFYCVSVDNKSLALTHANLTVVQLDIRNKEKLESLFNQFSFVAIFHCAAILAHGHADSSELWDSNVTATQYLIDLAVKHSVQRIIFTSSNCLWGRNLYRPVNEKDVPCPVEIYGRSKLAAEKILLEKRDQINVVIFRCPTIIDAGRMGLLSILFDFIREGRKVYLVGQGKNRYQFIYAQDLIDALLKSLSLDGSEIFNIGSDNVKSLSDVFNYVIDRAQTGASTRVLPKKITLAIMKLAYFLKVSPLGPYHYKMIAEDFVFDTQKAKKFLKWSPTLTNEEMLWKCYQYYISNVDNINQLQEISAHKQPAKMGVIKLLKWLS